MAAGLRLEWLPLSHHVPLLLISSLEHLPQADLRRVASTSRALRVAARHAGLYIHRTINWGPDSDIEQITTFMTVRTVDRNPITSGSTTS